jgi:hypothetical protein
MEVLPVRVALRALVAAAVALPLVLAGPVASAQTDGCPPDPDFHYTNVTYSHIVVGLPSSGTPGLDLTIAFKVGATVAATATGTVSGGINAIVAGARVDVSASLSVSMTAEITYSGSWRVPSGVHVGYLATGAQSRSMNWSYGSYSLGCQWIVHSTGTLRAPYQIPAFWTWTT